jgi:hypothetical protein
MANADADLRGVDERVLVERDAYRFLNLDRGVLLSFPKI